MRYLDVPIYFYDPSRALVESMPHDIAEYWSWITDAIKKAPAVRPKDQKLCTWAGPYNWTIQTFLHLKTRGVDCTLAASLPARGIILAHSDLLPPLLMPGRDQFIVEIKP